MGEERLEEVLREVARRERVIEAPPEIGESLRGAFDRLADGRRRQARRRRLAALATAAMLLAGVFIGLAVRRGSWGESGSGRDGLTAADRGNFEVAGNVEEDRSPALSPEIESRGSSRVRWRRAAVTDEVGEVSEWLAVAGAGSAGEFEYTMETRIPERTLRLWGIGVAAVRPTEAEDPGSEGTEDRLIDAEILFGEDGMVRAIRIIQ